MVKKTIYVGNPAYISLKDDQLVLKLIQDESPTQKTIPIEDIGVLVLDNYQITITHGLIDSLLNNNVAIISCDKKRLPVGLMLPLSGNIVQNERFRTQLDASIPLKKQLWQQTVQSKINNQASALKIVRKIEVKNMEKWINDVKSGDTSNIEARAAAYYWANFFQDFGRDRFGDEPNNFLNYGYAVLRAIVARSLVASGLLPTLGIHHHNKYNAYCLADDIMEPYRPFVDILVAELVEAGEFELNKDVKARLLSIPTLDVRINDQTSPLMVAVGITTASLYKCFSGELRRITYPYM